MDNRRADTAQDREYEGAEREDSLEFEAPKRTPQLTRKRPSRNRIVPNIFAAAVLISVMMIGGYWHIFGTPFQFSMMPMTMATFVSDEATGEDALVNKHFNMGGVRLGMTTDMMRRIYPSTKSQKSREGSHVVTTPTQRGMLVAWLYESKKYTRIDGELFLNGPQRIYRMRLDEAYTDLSEQDIVNRYMRTYGRPLDASCERDQMGDTPRCTYRWWGGDGIELTATLKSKTDSNGQEYVLLTTIATNTLKPIKQASANRFPLKG